MKPQKAKEIEEMKKKLKIVLTSKKIKTNVQPSSKNNGGYTWV